MSETEVAPQLVERRFSFTAGALVRGMAMSEIYNYCFLNHIECKISESKGFFESRIYIVVSCRSAEKLEYMMNLVAQWLADDNHRSEPISLMHFEQLRNARPSGDPVGALGVAVFLGLAFLALALALYWNS